MRVLVLLRQGGGREEFINVLKGLNGIDVRVFYRPDTLNPAMLQAGSTPQILLLDVDLSDESDLALIGKLRNQQVPLVALADRGTEMAALTAIRAGADDVLLKPIDPQEAQEVFARVVRGARHDDAHAEGMTAVFVHPTGGAGATTLAINAGCTLASSTTSGEVALLDLDIQFGNAANLLDLPSTSPIEDVIEDPERLDNQMLDSMMIKHSSGLRVLTAPNSPLPLSAFTPQIVRRLVQTAKRRFTHVVIDLPVALDTWTEAVLREATVIYVVCPATVPAVHRLWHMLALLKHEGLTNLPIKIVLNRYNAKGTGSDVGVAQFVKAIGRDVDHLIPNDYKLIGASQNEGKAAVQLKPGSTFAISIRDMLNKDVSGAPAEKKSLWSFFSREA